VRSGRREIAAAMTGKLLRRATERLEEEKAIGVKDKVFSIFFLFILAIAKTSLF
jgi:hypothetical protein